MKEKVENKISSKTELILKIIISLSTLVLTMILSNRFNFVDTVVGAFLSFVCMLFIIDKVKFKNISKQLTIISSIISCYMMKIFISFAPNRLSYYFNKITNIECGIQFLDVFCGILALPSLIFLVYKFIELIIPKVKEFLKTLTEIEKKYIYIILIIGIITSFCISHTTTAFTKPTKNGTVIDYDVIYTTDSGYLTFYDTYFNISCAENDVRQPLFGVFALPFAVVAKITSEFTFFFPKDYAYESVMMVIQFLLTTITTILIARLMNLEEKDKKYFYLLFSLSFPYLIFNIVLEQYVIGLFYLIFTIYYFYNYEGINYSYIGTVGTLITSGIIFPLISKFKNIKQWINDAFKCFLVFVAILVISGQFPQVTYLGQRLEFLTGFAKPLPIEEKFYQFSNFVSSIFFSSPGEIVNNEYYRLKVFSSINIIGVILLAISVVSAFINRKDKMAKISFLWVVFSVIILLVVGWGTTENGLILYSLYFSWAYLSLIYMFLKKIFKNRKLFVAFLLIMICIMAVLNIKELINIIIFAVKYY